MNKIKKMSLIFLLVLTLLILPGCSSLSIDMGTKYIKKEMYVGEELLLEVKTNSEDQNYNWTTSDSNVAIVSDEGLVVAMGVGEATITVTVGDLSTEALIIVHDRTIIEYDIEIIGKQYVELNKTIELRSQITPLDFDQSVIWTSSDEKIASVDKNGKVTGIMPGLVTITARSKVKPSLVKEVSILVRTGSGVQDVILNYIENHNYVTSGKLDLSEINNKVVNLVKNVEDSVIGVYNKAEVDGKEGVFTGTAGIYKQEVIPGGYKYTAFTNHHVIDGSKDLKVYLGSLDEYVPATVVKSDSNMDIAVITFEHKHNFTPLTLGEIGDIKKGDFVVAIGNPGGFEYYGSVTFGMVSSPNRLFKDRNMIYVQHDAPINPGNSGGPLFNLDGKVIGINTLKFAAADIEGMGFSIAMEKFLDYLK